MAYTVVSQTFYKDKLVQYANLVSTGSNFNNVYADLESYINHIIRVYIAQLHMPHSSLLRISMKDYGL